MKKAIAILLLAILSCCMLAGCTKPSSSSEPTAQPGNAEAKFTAEEVYQHVLAVSGFGEMTAVPKRDYIEIYGIDANNFADYAWYASENPSLNADEVVIFRLSKESYKDVLITLLEKHLMTRTNVAESYSPEEAGKLKQAQVVTFARPEGTWVCLCVGENYAAMMSALKADLG